MSGVHRVGNTEVRLSSRLDHTLATRLLACSNARPECFGAWLAKHALHVGLSWLQPKQPWAVDMIGAHLGWVLPRQDQPVREVAVPPSAPPEVALVEVAHGNARVAA
jgi:hypothetical protein